MERINLHETINAAHTLSPHRYPLASDIVAGFAELIQVRDPEGGKTYLYCLDYGSGHIMSDVCVIDRDTGVMTVIPQGDIDPEHPMFEGYRPHRPSPANPGGWPPR